MLIRLAWRNIFRNSRRTILAGLAIGVGLAALIFTDALTIGMENNMVRTATGAFLGEGQIHAVGFRKTLEVENTINDLDAVSAKLRAEPQVKGFTSRVQTFAMLTAPTNVAGIALLGIDPEREKAISLLDEVMIDGTFLEPTRGRRILVGSGLADRLEITVGDRVVVTAAGAGNGDLTQEMFRVGGIFRFGIRTMDDAMAFVHIAAARSLLGLEGQAHQIALIFAEPALGRNEAWDFWQRYSTGGNEALGWTRIVPDLVAVLEMSSFSMGVVLFILFGVVALSIMNVLFMSLYERMFEFGVLRAVGTRPWHMALLVVFEAACLGIISAIIGVFMGFGITWLTSYWGIDYMGVEYAGITFRELIYPQLRPVQFVLYPLCVLLFALLAAIYPAIFAARLRPAEAMRRSV